MPIGYSTGSEIGVSEMSHTFFIDRCLTGHRFRSALSRAGLRVESLEFHLPSNCDDLTWLPLVSAPPFEWVIITKDNSILSNPYEFDAICEYRARMILFPDQDLSATEMADRFLHYLSDILTALDTRGSPLIIVLHKNRIEIGP